MSQGHTGPSVPAGVGRLSGWSPELLYNCLFQPSAEQGLGPGREDLPEVTQRELQGDLRPPPPTDRMIQVKVSLLTGQWPELFIDKTGVLDSAPGLPLESSTPGVRLDSNPSCVSGFVTLAFL